MPRTRIKICGVTRPQDAMLAAKLGADYLGLNFVSGPRRISIIDANEIVASVPETIDLVSLKFLDDDNIRPSLDDLRTNPSYFKLQPRLGICQLYGLTEPWLELQRKRVPAMSPTQIYDHPRFWLPMSVDRREFLADLRNKLKRLQFNPGALLLDTASPSQLGGTGQPFNWHWIADARDAGELAGLPPIILAGGLTPDNVADAIRIARPYAVDVSSGVEVPGQPGIKDPVKLRDFIQAVQSAT